MARLRMMRAPQKYVQGKDSLLHFHEEMKDLETNGCSSVPTAATRCATTRSRRALKGQRTSAVMKSSAELPV